MSDSFASANGPSVAMGTPFSRLTTFAVLPSARPAWNTSSPDSVRSLSIWTMNPIISRIHSGEAVSIMVPASPNIMTMYFISFLPGFGAPMGTVTAESEPSHDPRHRREKP